MKCKELLQWRHSDLKGAMETPVTGWGGSCDVDVSLSAKADNLLKSHCVDERCVLLPRVSMNVQTYEFLYIL